MQITLRDMKGAIVTRVPVTQDEHGYLYAQHPTFGFEVDCALYGYQDGGVSVDVITDDDNRPYMIWEIN